MNEVFKLFGTIAIDGVDDAKRDIDSVTGAGEKASNKLVSSFKKIGTAVAAAFAVDKIIAFGKEIVNTAATVAAEESAFAQIMGDYAGEASEKMGKIADAVGMVDTRLTPYMTSMTAKFKGLGYDVEDATDYASRGLMLAADAAAFWDKSLDESMSHLNSFINGSYEGGEAIGLFANDTQMALYAVEQGIIADTKAWAKLDEATKQATRLEYAENMMKLSGATGQAAKESDQYANVQANLSEKWRQFKAQIGEPLLENVVIPAMKKLCDVVDALSSGFEKASKWVSENGDKIQRWTGYIIAAGVGVGTFLVYLNWGQIMSAAAAALDLVTMSIQKMSNAIKSNPIGLIISLVTSLIAYLIYLYNTNEEFRAFVDEMLSTIWAKLQEVIAWIEENVVPVIQTVISWIQSNVIPVVQEIIEWIQSNVIPAIQEVISWIQENVLPVIQEIIGWIQDNVIPVVESVIDFITGVIGGFFDWLVETFGSTGESVGGIWETIQGFFSTAWEFIQGVWAACQPFFQGIWDGIIMPVWGLIQEIIGAFQMAWDVIKLVWDYVKPYFQAVWEGIKAVFSVVGSILGMYFKNAWEGIKLVWGVVVEFFKLIWTGIKAVFSVVGAVLGGYFKVAWEVIKAVWSTVIAFFTMVWAGIKAVFAVVKGVLSGNFSDAWTAIKNLWDKAKNFFSTVWEGIKGVFGAVKSWFSNTFSAAWQAVKNVFSGWGSFFSGLWNRIKTTFSNLGTNIANAISGAVKSGINGVISMIQGTINTAINIINGAIGLINLIPGVDVGEIDHVTLPRLAKGGIVNKPTLAQIGEDGAEAVVPLEKNTGWIDRVAERISESAASSEMLEKVYDMLDYFLPQLLEASGHDIVTNDGAIIARYAPKFDIAMGKISARKGRGR